MVLYMASLWNSTQIRYMWLGCAPWVCVFGFGFWLHPATPGVCWCGQSACTPPLLAWVRAVGVCVWPRVWAAARHCWRVLVLALRLHPAIPGLGGRRGCVSLGSGFGCTPPLLACAGVGALLAPRPSWLRCTPWVCVFGLGSRRTPPLLACAGVGAPLAPRHSWLGCALWVCVFELGFRLHPAIHDMCWCGRCVVSFCSVWCCPALCCVLGRCPSSWGPVPSGAVFCLVPPRCVCFGMVCRCVVLFAAVLCAVCALGVALCVSCRLRPVRCCCLSRSPSVPCSPELCPVVLCCRVVSWCPVLPPC